MKGLCDATAPSRVKLNNHEVECHLYKGEVL